MIVIDQEFKALIPPLSNEELSQLEANIIADGCRDPLVLWGNTLIDGHNRYEICETHGIEYRTHNIELENREAALDWIDANQLGRRNLSPDVMSLIRGRMYNRRKKPKNDGGAGVPKTTEDQNDPRLSTAESMGQEFGVSAATIKRDGKFSEAVDALKDHVPEIESIVSAGTAPKKAIIEAAKNPDTAASTLSTGGHRTIGTGVNEWYTPADYIEKAREVLGAISLDPASCESANTTVKADIFFSIEDDGLKQEWSGTVWMNPPYSQPNIFNFMEKLSNEYLSGNVQAAIALTHNFTDTKWFHLAANSATAMCLTKGRVKFVGAEGEKAAPTCGQAFFYFGDNVTRFHDVFKDVGLVVNVIKR